MPATTSTTENRKETVIMKASNLNFQEMEKKGSASVLKRWASMDSKNNDNDSNNAHHFSVIKFPHIGKGASFSIGDCWPINIDGEASFYKVISVEDIIIPAGRYRCYKVSEEMKGRGINYYWFAPDVGLVKFDIAGIKGAFQGFSYEKAL